MSRLPEYERLLARCTCGTKPSLSSTGGTQAKVQCPCGRWWIAPDPAKAVWEWELEMQLSRRQLLTIELELLRDAEIQDGAFP